MNAVFGTLTLHHNAIILYIRRIERFIAVLKIPVVNRKFAADIQKRQQTTSHAIVSARLHRGSVIVGSQSLRNRQSTLVGIAIAALLTDASALVVQNGAGVRLDRDRPWSRKR